MIDLRSDTVTTPTPGMRRAMANAAVGDDVFSEDPTVNALQEEVADLFGKQDALFVPTGCMGNQIGIALHAGTGDEVIVEAESHIFHYETTAPSIIARVQLHCVPSEKGMMRPEDIVAAIRPDAYYYPRTKLICWENSHNRHGGTLMTAKYLKAIGSLRSNHGIALHCDGARIWNAEVASGISLRTFGKTFDTLSVCLSKGLGAPAGSMLVGTKEQMRVARRWRKILGGGMRQVGVLAAAGRYALKYHREKLARDHENAKLFASLRANCAAISVDTPVPETNIVVFKAKGDVRIQDVLSACERKGVRFSAGRSGGWIRAVFHHQVSTAQTRSAAERLLQVAEALGTKKSV
ncbi:MAG: GntG family PLP-dependent aldolase [Candidatus Kapaibacterium sp.]